MVLDKARPEPFGYAQDRLGEGLTTGLALLIRAFLPIRGSEMPVPLIKRRNQLFGDA